jgi:hypothetical protein
VPEKAIYTRELSMNAVEERADMLEEGTRTPEKWIVALEKSSVALDQMISSTDCADLRRFLLIEFPEFLVS